jgi:hypothetical protein
MTIIRRFLALMYRDVYSYLKRSRYNFNGFFNQKHIETTRTDILNTLLSSSFKVSKNPSVEHGTRHLH